MSSERKNVVVFNSGDVYTFLPNNIKPSVWMLTMSLNLDDATLFQGPVFDQTRVDDVHGAVDDDDLDALYEWLYGDEHSGDRSMIDDTPNASLDEFLSLAFPKSVLGNEFDGVMNSVHEVHNTWMEDEYGVSDDSSVVMRGLVEIDWDSVASDYDSNSGRELLEGRYVVYIVDQV